MKYREFITYSAGLSLLLASCNKQNEGLEMGSEEKDSSEKVMEGDFSQLGEIDYNVHVRPILSETCFHCHGPDAATREAGFAIHTYDYATMPLKEAKGKFGIVPGSPELSEAIIRIFSEDKDELMPPADSIHKLTARQKNILKEWVRQGAKYKKHWAFIPPVKDLPEEEKENAWVKNPIDAFVAAKQKELGLSPTVEAAPEVWLRRVTLALTGMQPSPEELDAFLADQSEGAKEKTIDRLFKSPRYGEHMAVAWLEASRYADTDGYQNDHERENWPWRDYVIKAFNENKRFDEFTIEQVAGDMLPNATDEQIIASAWNRNHRQNAEGGALAEEYFIENVLDRVDTLGTTYFALSMSCARCHDHKYDPISQKEVFQLSAYFNNIKEKPIGRGVLSTPLKRSISLFASDDEVKLDQNRLELEKKLAKIRADVLKVIKKESPQLKGLALERKIAAVPEYKAVREELGKWNEKIKKMGGSPAARVMVMKEAEGLTPTYLLERGQYTDPDKSEELARTVPAFLLGDEASPKDRLELAKWMMSEKNPMTARVLMNRVWMHFFSVGICATSEDFGSQASYPTHPKLLDWLAVEFRESGWDLQHMQKLIMLSATYGQSSKVTAEMLKQDPDNQWFTRGPRFRLSGYAIRDQALHASGLLYEKLGGPSVKPYQPAGLWAGVSANKGQSYKPSKGKDLCRRSIYTYWKRAVAPPSLALFDGALREICTVSQNRTNTPLQALALMNDVTFLEAARNLAQEVILDESVKSEDRVDMVYSKAIGYPISDKKKEILTKSYEDFSEFYDKTPEEAKALVNLGSSNVNKEINVNELAALTAVAHIIMNTDEMINAE